MHKAESTQRLLRSKVFAVILGLTAGTAMINAASAQDVSYQESLDNGAANFTLTLQNYTIGSALSASNYVGFSFTDKTQSVSDSLSDSTGIKLMGSLSLTNPSSDNVNLFFNPVIDGKFLNGYVSFVQQSGVASVIICDLGCGKPGGKPVGAAKYHVEPGAGFKPTASAPELDVSSLSSALTLLLGSLVIVHARLKQTS